MGIQLLKETDIGDQIGRKATVIITTAMMALTCLAMANLPTYAQIC